MQSEINEIEQLTHEIGQRIGEIEDAWKQAQVRISQARDRARYMFDNPEALTMSDVEEYGAKIMELLDGI